jgi:hypothetical protein
MVVENISAIQSASDGKIFTLESLGGFCWQYNDTTHVYSETSAPKFNSSTLPMNAFIEGLPYYISEHTDVSDDYGLRGFDFTLAYLLKEI